MRVVPFVVATFLLLLALSQVERPLVARAVESPLRITRVAAYPPSDHEWIEVRNTGASDVDVTKWKFWEDNTNHGIAAFQGGSMLPPGATAIVADRADLFFTDNPAATGTVFDSSWSTLNLDGEPVGLRDPSGALFQFPDELWMRDEPSAAPPAAPEAPTPTATSTPSIDVHALQLSEAMTAPADGSEWVEILNTSGNDISLDGLALADSVGTVATLSGNVAGNGFYVVTLKSSRLNNGGDAIRLLGTDGLAIDEVRYGDDGIPAPAKGSVLARGPDGWTVSTSPTPGSANSITLPAADSDIPEVVVPDLEIRPGSVVINEIMPAGGEDGDWIELANRTTRRLNLSGWQVTLPGSQIPLSGWIAAGKHLLVRLNGDALPDAALLFLVAPNSQTVDQVAYGAWEDGQRDNNAPAASAGLSIARHEGQDTDVDVDDFFVASRPSPAKANDEPGEATVSSLPTARVILPLCVLPEQDGGAVAAASIELASAKKTSAKKTTVKKTTTKKASGPSYVAKSLSELAATADGTYVTTQGTVVGVDPDSSGKKWFLQDGTAGVQLSVGGHPPALNPGDQVRVKGKLGWSNGPSLATDLPRITRLGGQASSTPSAVAISALGPADGQRFITVQGTVTSVRDKRATISADHFDLAVALPPGVPAPGKDTELTASGIYLASSPPLFLVLGAHDVSMVHPNPPPPKTPSRTTRVPQTSPWPMAIAIGTLAGVAGMTIRRLRKHGRSPLIGAARDSPEQLPAATWTIHEDTSSPT